MQNHIDSTSSNSDDDQNIVNTIELRSEVEALFEKRTDVREIALAKLVNAAAQYYCYRFIDEHSTDILKALRTAIALPNSDREHQLACQLLQLGAVTCPAEWKEYYQDLSTLLQKSIDSSTAYEHKAGSMRAYGLITFLWGETENTVEAVTYLSELLQEPREDDDEGSPKNLYYVTVLNTWSFLVTTLDNDYIIDQLLPEMISEIVEYTTSCDPEIKIAAFKALALLVEVVHDTEGESYSPQYFNGYFDVPALITTLRDLATGNARVVAKKHKNRYKGLEPVLNTLEEGTSLSEKITLKNQKFTFSTWYEATQLARFREILGVGFQHHFTHNELMCDIFDITFRKQVALSPQEKRSQRISNAKQNKERSNWVKKGRSQKRHTDTW